MQKLYYLFLIGGLLIIGCRSTGDGDKIAEVDGTVITRSEIDSSAGKQLQTLREQMFKLEQQKLDEYIGAMLLTREAKNRNVSVNTLLEQEVNAKVALVSDEEIQFFYENNKDRLRVELDKVRDQIRDYLREQKIANQKKDYFKTLVAKAKVTTFLKPPPVQRINVTTNGGPVKGAEAAKVTIVKFEDFQCPYCKTVQASYQELLKRYNGKLRLVHKDLPLDAIHPQARQAAEAARCAGDQGKYWQYHDKLYALSPKLAAEDLKNAAKDVGLDLGSFEQCVSTGKFKAAVQKDFNDAADLGLTGTPSFFINGRELSGAQPLEAFTAIIDEELALAK